MTSSQNPYTCDSAKCILALPHLPTRGGVKDCQCLTPLGVPNAAKGIQWLVGQVKGSQLGEFFKRAERFRVADQEDHYRSDNTFCLELKEPFRLYGESDSRNAALEYLADAMGLLSVEEQTHLRRLLQEGLPVEVGGPYVGGTLLLRVDNSPEGRKYLTLYTEREVIIHNEKVGAGEPVVFGPPLDPLDSELT